MSDLGELFERIARHPTLRTAFTLETFVRFIRLIAACRNDILLSTPARYQPTSTDQPPEFLSQSITLFLSRALAIPQESVREAWSVLRDVAWHQGVQEGLSEDLEGVFGRYGHANGFTSTTFYPPNTHCTNPTCRRLLPLTKAEQRKVIFISPDKGSIPAWAVRLYCDTCGTGYDHNFYVRGGLRTYYDGMPDTLQVSSTRFISRALIENWVASMLFAWTSASNCAKMYNETVAQKSYSQDGGHFKPMTPFLKTEHVWDGFVLFTLLEDYGKRGALLRVPHGSYQSQRFDRVMETRNIRIKQQGLPEVYHWCTRCTRIYDERETGGGISKVSVVVTDGITVGHPCCAVHNCKIPLARTRDRFCPDHHHLHRICAVRGCDRPVEAGSLVCALPAHAATEERRHLKSQARFSLRNNLVRTQVGPANNDASAIVDTGLQEFDVDPSGNALVAEDRGPTACPQKPRAGNVRIQVQFGRKRTHNEQIIVAPCGVIIARDTFFGAEAVSSVQEFFERVYRQAPCPNHLFYDNNCHLARTATRNPAFKNTGFSVDPFHFGCKHSELDEYCQKYCNPASFPELKKPDNSWYFNSSIAEQTNAWLGGYHSMCREMTVSKYNFFLDEMISRRNVLTLRSLAAKGHLPSYWDNQMFA